MEEAAKERIGLTVVPVLVIRAGQPMGGVTEPNAHPHISANLISVVHNGIIENFESERSRLQKRRAICLSRKPTLRSLLT